MAYGGVKALDRVSLEVPSNTIVGLVGPNGSGKTTVINALTGIEPITSGSIELDEIRIDELPVHQRVVRGMARTFQTIHLFETLTVTENLLVGASHRFRTGYLASVIRTGRFRMELRRESGRAQELMAVFGDRLLSRQNDSVASLSYANRRRVEICRALMAQPGVLLLDEPAAGMNPHETHELGLQLGQLQKDLALSMLVIEHKMDFLAYLCSKVQVLDHGLTIAEGSPDAIQQVPAVIEAFLGAS